MRIRLTKAIIVYLVVLVLSAYPAALVNGVAGYLPFFALLICGICAFVHILLIEKKISCTAQLDGAQLTRGDETPFQVVLENRSFLPVPLLEVSFYVSDEHGQNEHIFPLNVTLSPKETRNFSLTADFPHLGLYQVGVKQVKVRDLLGIFSARSNAAAGQEISVQPKLVLPRDVPVSEHKNQESQKARTASALSGMDYVGVREYALGDPIKMIQWKLSAHSNGLMTKQMESYTNTGVGILMDFAAEGYDTETALNLLDAVVECGMSIGRWAMGAGMEYVMVMPGDTDYFQCVPSSFADLRQYMPNMYLREDKNSEQLVWVIRERCARAHAQTNAVICTACLNREIVTALQYLKHSRKNPILYLLMPNQVDEKRHKETTTLLSELQAFDIPYVVGETAQEVLG